VLQALKSGAVVCSFPEGAISRTGQLMALRPGFEMMARRADVPVVPVAHDGLWGSVFSFAGNKYLWKSPRLMPTPVFVVFGRPIPPDRIDVAGARNAMLDLAAEAFQERPILRRHLGRETVRALAKRPRHLEIIDRTAERREITAAQLLATAAALSRHIRRTIPDRRVGIVCRRASVLPWPISRSPSRARCPSTSISRWAGPPWNRASAWARFAPS